MAKTGVLGKGPISFFIAATRSQVSIPLSALIFEDGTLKVSSSAARPDLVALPGLSAWLDYLASQGFVTAAPTIPAPQAIVFQAVDPGVTGNDVSVEIVYPAASHTYTAKVTKTDRYTGLTRTNLAGILGTSGPGTQPGLVRVKDASAFTAPGNATASPDPSATVGPTDQATIDFDFGGGNTLALAASRPGADGKKLTVAIEVTDAASGTFSVTAIWTTTITIDTTALPSAWATAYLAAGYVLTVGPPASGTLGLPAAGVYVLSGGADAAPAAQATATALAGS
ncbi:MAG TPA: hypothetical protein VFT22_23465 [Kofleriaceae bacterium]|nr:hypothetical protein [Kofleriaceae bacterium]